MADENLLSLLSAADLAGFSQRVEQNDPYGIIGKSLASWQPNYSYMNAGESALTSFGKAFASGLLSNYAQNRSADQLSSVVSVLPQLSSDPMSVTTPEGVDSSAFNLLRGSAYLNKLQEEKEEKALGKTGLADLLKTVLGEGVKSGTISGADAVKAMTTKDFSKLDSALDADKNPNSPAYKAKQDLFDDERSLANDFIKDSVVKDFKYKEQGLKALEQAYKDKSGTSDFELLRRTAQMVEPGLAVRADDQASLQGAASLFGMTESAIKAIASGQSKLEDGVRSGMMRIAKRAYNSTLNDYNTIRDSYLKRATESNLNIENVVPYGAGQAFESLFPDLNIDQQTVETRTGTPVSAQQAQQIIAQAKMKYGDTPEAREIAKRYIDSLSSPKSNSGTPLG